MAKNLNDVLAALPPKRRAKVEQRAGELATLKDLRLAVEHTQQDLAASLGVGQDTISRIERRSGSLRCAAISRRWVVNSIWSHASRTARPSCSITSRGSSKRTRSIYQASRHTGQGNCMMASNLPRVNRTCAAIACATSLRFV